MSSKVTIIAVNAEDLVVKNEEAVIMTFKSGTGSYAKGQVVAMNLTTGDVSKYSSVATNGLEKIQGIYIGEDTLDTTSAAKTGLVLIEGTVLKSKLVGITYDTDYNAQLQCKYIDIKIA